LFIKGTHRDQEVYCENNPSSEEDEETIIQERAPVARKQIRKSIRTQN